MIELTRLNGNAMVLNSDLIKTVESSPDTTLTLINGEKLIVKEQIADVAERVIAYRVQLLAGVARRLPDFAAVQRATALASLDVAGQQKNSSALPPRNKTYGL